MTQFFFCCWLLFTQWSAFCFGYFFQYPELPSLKSRFILISPVLFCLAIVSVYSKRIYLEKYVNAALEKHTKTIQQLSHRHWGYWIALAAGLGLYAELSVIRLHSSYFQLFAFFKNISLLSCFLGLGIGYGIGSRLLLMTPLVIPAMSLQILTLVFLRHSSIEPFLQNPIPDQIAFGLSPIRDLSQILSVYGFMCFFFTLNALSFIPLGQLAAFLMEKEEKLRSYQWNLIGSVMSILLFTCLSFLETPPLIWFLIMLMGLFLFLRKDSRVLFPSSLWALVLLIALGFSWKPDQIEVYSPYQILNLKFSEIKEFPLQLKVSNTFFQNILDLTERNTRDKPFLKEISGYYNLPYLFKKRPSDVLIVGSGTGNDVAAALRNGATRIDAVEIDPAILRFGLNLHPERPYHDKRVNKYVSDARSFIRQTKKKYDLVVFGLLDSHVTLSGNSNIRLDNFVYTLEAFAEVRSKLKNDGLLFMAVSLGKGEAVEKIAQKLFFMLSHAFDGYPPRVYKTNYDEGYSFIIGNQSELNRVYPNIPFQELTGGIERKTSPIDLSTDDWPFLFMPNRKYPLSYFFFLTILLILSYVLIRRYSQELITEFSFPFFFLGAGFMLLETKAITELGLTFGNTWLVVSITVLAILLMSFLANFTVMKKKKLKLPFIYTLILLSTIASQGLSRMDFWQFTAISKFVMPLLLTFPIYFAGLAFSSEFKRTSSLSVAMSSNLFGAMLGGILEYNTMYLGFRSLYGIAFLMYLFAFASSVLLKPKARP